MAGQGNFRDPARASLRRPDGARGLGVPAVARFRLTPIRIVIGLAFLGSAGLIGYAIVVVRDSSQIPILSAGFAVLGLATSAIAIALVVELWRAAADGRSARALALAILGGLVGLAAIACFTMTALLALLMRSS